MPDTPPTPDTRKRQRVINAASRVLADQLRRDPAGLATDNRLEQSAHYRGVIYVAIKAVMDAVSGCTVRVTRRRKAKREKVHIKGPVAKAMPTPHAHQNDEKWVPVSDPGHSLVRLLDRPNRTETIQDLLAVCVLQYQLTGTALLWANRDGMGLPRELYVLPTALCFPQPATPDAPMGWWRVSQYYPSGALGMVPSAVAGGGAPVDGRDVFRFRNPHPLWRWDAYSPLTAGKHQLDILESIDQARWTAMDAGLTPSMVLMTPGLGQQQLDTALDRLAETNAGKRNHRKILGIGGEQGDEKWSVEFPDTAPKDMDFSSGWEQMVSFCLAVFGVPKSVAGLAGTGSYAELYAALKQFHTLTLGPLAARLARWLTRHLAHVWGRDYAVEIDLPRIDDTDLQERQVSTDAQNSAITVNELRALRNRPPVEDGDLPPKVYEAKLTAKMQAEQQQEMAAQAPQQPGGAPGGPPGNPGQPGAPADGDPMAALAAAAGGGQQQPPVDAETAVMSAFGLKGMHWRLHGKFVSRAKYLAAIAAGEVQPDGAALAALQQTGGGQPVAAPAANPAPQAPEQPAGPDPRVEAYHKLRKAGKPVPECVGRVFGPALADVAGGLKGDPGDDAEATAAKRAGDVAKWLKVSEGEAKAVILAAFEALAREAKNVAPDGHGQPQAAPAPAAGPPGSGQKDEEQPEEEGGQLAPPGPPGIPQPKNRAGAGSLPPQMKSLISTGEVLEAGARTEARVREIATRWFWPNGSAKTRTRTEGKIRDTMERYGVPLRVAARLLERAMTLWPDNHVVGGSQAYWELVGRMEAAEAATDDEKPKPHKYGCVYARLPAEAAAELAELGRQIPDEHLADDGREDDPHVTLLFGLHDSVGREDVKRVLAGAGPVRFRLGAVSVFRGADSGRDYDVVKADVLGNDCPRLHGTLCSLPHTQTHPRYVPHATIAYVRAGLGDHYAHLFGRLDLDCEVRDAVFSDPDRVKARVPLCDAGPVEKAMSALSDAAGGALVPPAGSGEPVPVKRNRAALLRRKKRRRRVEAVCKALLAEVGAVPGDGEPMDTGAAVDALLAELAGG